MYDRINWTDPRLRAQIESREGVSISRSRLSKALRKNSRWQRSQQALEERRIGGNVERIGLHLYLGKQEAEADDFVLLYGDESEALTHSYIAQGWAKSGADERVPAPGQARKVAVVGPLDHVTRRHIVHTRPTKRSSDFIAHLRELSRLGRVRGRTRAIRRTASDSCPCSSAISLSMAKRRRRRFCQPRQSQPGAKALGVHGVAFCKKAGLRVD